MSEHRMKKASEETCNKGKKNYISN